MTTVRLTADVVVRACIEADLEPLEWFGLFSDHRELIREAYARSRRGEVAMLVGDLGGRPIAQLWIDRTKRAPERIGVIWAVRVFPILQGRGIGTAMMQHAEAMLAAEGFLAVELGVEKGNPAARRLYERLGYREVGEVSEAYAYTRSDGTRVRAIADQWILRKPLQPRERSLHHG